MSALSNRQSRRLCNAWADARDRVYVAIVRTPVANELFVEIPDILVADTDLDGMLDAVFRENEFDKAEVEEHQDALVRLFTKEEEAGWYSQTIAAFHSLDNVDVACMSIEDLFGLRFATAVKVREALDRGVRFELSTVQPEEMLPTSVDTLWASVQQYV